MQTPSLKVGLESISYWRVGDDVHLPPHGKNAPRFLARDRELDEILCRPSLDERLTDFLRPAALDPDLLEPSVLSASRAGARHVFEEAALRAEGNARDALQNAVAILAQEVELDQEVRNALGALLKG